MKKILSVFAFSALMLVPVIAIAQEEGTPVAFEETVSTERLDLAKQMQDIWPIRTRIETAIDSVAQSFPPERQAEVKATIRKSIQYDQLEEESIQALASTYTADELRAMVDFYGSETGRAISAKTSDYEAAIRPSLVRMMDKAMLDLKTGLAR